MSEPVASVANAHAFVQRLIDLGLKHAVLSPGSRNAPLSITLAKAADQGLITLHVRIDEREAAFLALGLSKVSGVPTLLCCTSGTAAVNFAPAVVEAFYSQVPLVVLTADRPEGAAARGASQSIQQRLLFAPHTVANLHVSERADAQVSADRARIAWSASIGPNHGPAHVNFHLAEPLLAPISDWPAVAAATPAETREPAPNPPAHRAYPALGAKPVLVIGEVPQHERSTVAQVIAQASHIGIPLLMEPTAAPRQAAVSIRHHALISDELADQVTGVVSVGRFGLGRHLRRLCSAAPSHIAFSAYGAGADPFGTVNLTLAMESLPDFFRDAESFDATWLRAWRAADAEAAERVAAATHRWADQPTGVHIAREVLAAAHTHDSLVFAAASRSIRDVDLIAGFDGPRVLANLGVNGIDGLLSTAAGVALSAGAPTYALIGDIAFLHGSNGLLWPDDEPQPNLTIVVNDDNGGAIFSDLEQGAQDYAPWFERVFGTPHNRDLVSLARGFGVDAVEVFDLQQLRAELEPHEGIKVVVVVGCDRETSRDFRKSLRKA